MVISLWVLLAVIIIALPDSLLPEVNLQRPAILHGNANVDRVRSRIKSLHIRTNCNCNGQKCNPSYGSTTAAPTATTRPWITLTNPDHSTSIAPAPPETTAQQPTTSTAVGYPMYPPYGQPCACCVCIPYCPCNCPHKCITTTSTASPSTPTSTTTTTSTTTLVEPSTTSATVEPPAPPAPPVEGCCVPCVMCPCMPYPSPGECPCQQQTQWPYNTGGDEIYSPGGDPANTFEAPLPPGGLIPWDQPSSWPHGPPSSNSASNGDDDASVPEILPRLDRVTLESLLVKQDSRRMDAEPNPRPNDHKEPVESSSHGVVSNIPVIVMPIVLLLTALLHQ